MANPRGAAPIGCRSNGRISAVMRSVFTITLTVAALYLLLAGALFGCQRQMMYMPMGAMPDPAGGGLPEAEVLTARTVDGLDLTSWYVPASAPERATLIVFQGNAGNLSHRAFIARHLAEEGYGVVLAGYRGYGGNPGRPTEDGLLDDGRAILDRLAELGVDGQDVVVYGESLGSGVAVRMAAERPVGGVVLISPFTSAVDVAARAYPIFPVRLLMKDRFDNLTHIGSIDAPLLVFHGERDTIVPTQLGTRLYEAANEPKRLVLMENAGHNDLYHHGALEAVVDFLNDF